MILTYVSYLTFSQLGLRRRRLTLAAVGVVCAQVPVSGLALVAAAARHEALTDAPARHQALEGVGVRLALAAVLRAVRVTVTR